MRAAKRLASALRATWYAVCVETPATANLSSEQKTRLTETLQLAEQLGAKTVTLPGQNVAEELLAYARQKNITKIVIGKPEQSRWREWLFGSIVADLIRQSGSVDVYVIRHERDKGPAPRRPEAEKPTDYIAYAWAGAICLLATVLGIILYHIVGGQRGWLSRQCPDDSSAGGAICGDAGIRARAGGRGVCCLPWPLLISRSCRRTITLLPSPIRSTSSPSRSCSLPRFDHQYADRSHSENGIRRRAICETAHRRSCCRSAATLPRCVKSGNITKAVVQRMWRMYSIARAASCSCPTPTASWRWPRTSREIEPPTEKELSVVQWVFDHRQLAGRGTSTLPAAAGIFLPMSATRHSVGVLGAARRVDNRRTRSGCNCWKPLPINRHWRLERAILAEESQQAWERVEAEFLRNTLLSGVSHDLRTPLAAITGAASSSC